MTWARVKETGSGSLAFRLVIAGHPIVFVSSPALVGADTDGRIRVAGLDARSCSTFAEKLNPAKCELTADGFTAKIIEDGSNRIGDSFNRLPTKINYLSTSITKTDVAIPLVNTNTANADVLFVGRECVLITSGGGTASPTITRAYRNTTAQAHVVNATVGLARPEVTTEDALAYNGRPSVEGLDVFLYVYGDGETGTGTLIWRGIVAMQPRLPDLVTWEIACDSVTSVLDQALSGDLQGPVQVRGAYYHAATLPVIHITRLSGATSGSATTTDTVDVTPPAGVYETQEAWCIAVTEAIRAATTGFTPPLNPTSGAAPRIAAVVTSDGSWALQYTTVSASPLWYDIDVDGALFDPFMSSTWAFVNPTTGAMVSTVATSSVYGLLQLTSIDGAGTMPRGYLGIASMVGRRVGGGIAAVNQIYLGGIAAPTVGDTLVIAWPAFNGLPEVEASHNVVTAWDSTNRVATVEVADQPIFRRAYVRDALPTITVARTYESNGNVADFLAGLCAAAPADAPEGRQPFVTTTHVDTTTTSTNVAAAVAGRAWVAHRLYAGRSDFSLAKYIAEECKLAGLVPSIGTDGRMLLVRFRIGAATEDDSYTITSTRNLSTAQLPGFEPSAFGMVNTISFKTGFDPSDGKHHGDAYILSDATALSRNPLPSVMKIEPRSSAAGGDDAISIDDVRAMASGWFGVLGASYATIVVACPLSAFDAIIGTQCSVTISQLPDAANGGRGVTLLPGVVIGRAVDLFGPTVTLTVLVTYVRIAGYTPSALIDSAGNVSGNTWDFNIDESEYFASGQVTADCFAAGYAVRMTQRYVASPTELDGTVVSVTGSTIRVTFTGAYTDRTPDDVLEFDNALTATTAQQAWCFIGQDDELIGFATAAPTRQFAG